MVKRRKMGTTGGNQKSELQRETPILHSNSERLHLSGVVLAEGRFRFTERGSRSDYAKRQSTGRNVGCRSVQQLSGHCRWPGGYAVFRTRAVVERLKPMASEISRRLLPS